MSANELFRQSKVSTSESQGNLLYIIFSSFAILIILFFQILLFFRRSVSITIIYTPPLLEIDSLESSEDNLSSDGSTY